MGEPPKRPIDRRRDAAVSLAIDSPDDQTQVVATFEIDARLCMVTQKGVYAAQLADQTDPKRSNPAVRDSMQRLLKIGAEDVIVSRILLTGERLFKAAWLGPDFDEKRALSLAWRQTKDVAALAKMAAALEQDQQEIVAGYDQNRVAAAQITLPTIEDVEHRFHAFAQKLGHAVNTLGELVRLFYPELSGKWIDNLTRLAADRYGADSPFARYMGDVGKTLLFMRDLRNMVEHPKPGFGARVFDFRLMTSAQILVPSVEFEGSPYGTLPNALNVMMNLLTEGIRSMTEELIGLLCSVNLKSLAGFEIKLMRLAPEKCGDSHVRLVYGGERDGKIFLCG
jgi:hypothetical protein